MYTYICLETCSGGSSLLIHKCSCQALPNCQKRGKFFVVLKLLIFRVSAFYPSVSYNYKKLSIYKIVYKNLFLIKNVYLLDTFSCHFFLKPKLNKYFSCFCFEI